MVDQHRYDRASKALMDDHATEIVPELIPGSQLIQEQNTEVNRTNLRADLVYLIKYKGKPHTLNLELQTDIDADMNYRMLRYHVELYGKYRLPVISVVMYPFETDIPEPVFREESGEEVLLKFPYRALALWTLEAEQYIRKNIVSMYTLLPAMKGVNVPMLVQALDAMEQKYGRGSYLARHLWRFQIILRRSKMLSDHDKRLVEEKMESYDSLLESDPEIQKMITDSEIRGQQKNLLIIVETRFPALAEIAQQKITRFSNANELNLLTRQLIRASDETMARNLLDISAA